MASVTKSAIVKLLTVLVDVACESITWTTLLDTTQRQQVTINSRLETAGVEH